MFESLVADIIAKYIGEYIKNISSEQLKINVFSGNAVLKNLEIKGEALQSFKLPLHVQKGIIGTLTLKIPWTNIKSSPVILEIDSISLYAIPQTGFEYNEEEEKRKQLEYKKKKLEKFELIRSFKEGNANEMKSQKKDTFMESVMSKILNNIQVKIQNFHLRYEEIRGGKVYSLGISFGSLTAFPTDNNWQTMNPSETASSSSNNNGSQSLFKYIELTNFSIYLNSENKEEASIQSIVQKNDNQLFIQKLNSMIGVSDNMGTHQYILKPITVKLKIELNRNLNQDLDVPRMRVYCKFEQISFVIEENQYQTILKLLTTIGNYAQEIKYLKYRPKGRPKDNPRGWWRYVGDVVRESIREKIQKRSWTFIQKRRQNRKEYVLLFKKLQNVDWLDPLSEKELQHLSEMEEQLSFEDIIYFRSLARRELLMETEIADQKKGELLAIKRATSVTTTNKSWYSGWGGWYSGNNSSTTSSSSSNDTPKFSIQLTKEQQNEILKSMEYDEIALSATIEMPPHYITNIIEVQIDAVIFTVIGSRQGEDPLIKSYLNNINFKLSQRETGFKLELDLESFNVLDNNKNNSLFSYVVTSNPKYKRAINSNQLDNNNNNNNSTDNSKLNNNLFHIIFESKPINSSYDYALSLVLKSLEIIINKQQIERLVEFATPKETVNLFSLSSAALEEFILLKEMTIFQLREVVNHHKTIDLFIDAKAPILIIPEHYSNQDIRDDTNLIILDLGNFLMQSDLSKKPRKTITLEDQQSSFLKLTENNKVEEEEEDSSGQVEKEQEEKNIIKTNEQHYGGSTDDDDLKISDLYDHYRASLSSIKVLLATHKQDWYSPDESNSKGYQLIEEMSINLHIQSCIEPNELSLTMFKVSGILPQVKMNISDNSYLRLYRMAKTLSRIHSKTTTTTITAYNHIRDIYSNTQDTFVQQVDDAVSTSIQSNLEIKLSDEYKQVLSKRKIFDASFKLEKVLINIKSISKPLSNSNNNLLQLRISNLQVSLKKRTYDYKGNLLLGSFEVEDCQETNEKFNCLITSQSRYISINNNNSNESSTNSLTKSLPNLTQLTNIANKLISIDTDIIDKESPNYQSVDTFINFSFGELNFNYNPKSMGKILIFLDYCFEETFILKEQFSLIQTTPTTTTTSISNTPFTNSPLLNSTTTTTSINHQQPSLDLSLVQEQLQQQQIPQQGPTQQQPQQPQQNSIIKAKASIYSLSISLNEDGKELGRFSINEFSIDECIISGRSLEIGGRLESITIDSFLDHPTDGFKILTPKDSGVSMAKFKYCSFNQQSNQINQINKEPKPINQFDKEIELYLKSIRLTVLVDFILKTKHLIELPFKTVKYDSLYRYQEQQKEQQKLDDNGESNNTTTSTSTSTNALKQLSDFQPIGFKPSKINYKIFLESPQVILSSSDDIHSNHDRIIAELGSIDIKTTIIRNNQKLLPSINNNSINEEEEVNVDWESIEANLCDMNIKTFKNGNYHQVLHNLSIYNRIDTIISDEFGRYVPYQRLPQQKKINVDIKEIKVEFMDLEHSLIFSLTKDVINRITSSMSSTKSNKSNSLSNSTKLLPPPPSSSSLSASSSTLFANSDKKYLITKINLIISSFQLIMKLDVDHHHQNDFSTIKVSNISLISESCERNTINSMNVTIDDLVLYDDRIKEGHGYNKLIEKSINLNNGEPSISTSQPLIKIEILNFKEKSNNEPWDNSIIVQVQPIKFVLSLGLILGIKDFFLLPFVTTLNSEQLKHYDANLIDVPTLQSVVESISNNTKLKLNVHAHQPQIILPLSNHSNKVLVMDIKGGVKLTNQFTPLFVEEAQCSFEYEEMFITLDQSEFNVCSIVGDSNSKYNIKVLETISSDSAFNVKVNYSSWDSIYTNTIELLTCGKQPTEVDVKVEGFSLTVNETQYQLFCDMLAHLLRCLDDSPKLKLKKRNPYMLNVLLDRTNASSIQSKILDIFGMKVWCEFNQVLLNLLSNDGNSTQFSNLILENVKLSIDMATENRPKKMLIKGTVDELNVWDCRGVNSVNPFRILERYSKDKPMMEFSQLMYQFTSEQFPKDQLYSSCLDFNLNNIKAYALPSFALRIWDWVILSITQVFGTYQYDKYNIDTDYGSADNDERDQIVLLERLGNASNSQINNRMKMNVNIPTPVIVLPSDIDSKVSVEIKPTQIRIFNEFIKRTNCLGLMDYQDQINIALDSIDINLLTYNGVTESNILNQSNLIISMETLLSIDQYDINMLNKIIPTNKFSIKSTTSSSQRGKGGLEFKFDQIQYQHFYHCVNNALKRHYEMDSKENQIYLKPNFVPKSNDMITSILLDSITFKLLCDNPDDNEIDKIHSEIIIYDLSLENLINSKEESMQVIGLLGNLKVIDSINQIVIIEPISTNIDRFFTMFKYKTIGNGGGLIAKDPLQWETEFEFSMKSVQINLSLPNINVPISIQSFLLSPLEKYPIATRPSKQEISTIITTKNNSKPKMKIDINLLYSKIIVSPYSNSLNSINYIGSIQTSTGINLSASQSTTNLSPYDYMVISFNNVSMKHQPNQLEKLVDDSDLLLLDIENIQYKVSQLQIEIVLSQKKPYFLLTDIDIDIKQKTIRNHDEIINKIEWESGNPLDKLNNLSTSTMSSPSATSSFNSSSLENSLGNDQNKSANIRLKEFNHKNDNDSDDDDSEDTENYSKLFNDDLLLLSKSKTSIHSNASQIDLNSNHFQFLWNLYQSIGKISDGNNKEEEEGIENKEESTSTTKNQKDNLLNMIEFQLKDIKINLINEFNKPILNISLKQLETYLCHYESTSNKNTFKIIGTIKSFEAKDIRRESLLNSKYQYLFTDNSNQKNNSIQFTYKPWSEKSKEELFNDSRLSNSNKSNNNNNNDSNNYSNPEITGKFNQHLILTIKNCQVTPIFDLFSDIQNHFLPSDSLMKPDSNYSIGEIKLEEENDNGKSKNSLSASSRVKIDLSLESISIILPMNFEIKNYYLRNDIKRLLISNDCEVNQQLSHSTIIESNIFLLDINGFTMDAIMDDIIDSSVGQPPRQSRIIRDSNIFIISKMLQLPTTTKFKKPISLPNLETSIEVESLDFLFCLEEYKFMYDTLNSTLKRYYDFKYLPLLSHPDYQYKSNDEYQDRDELIQLENKTKLTINSLVMNMFKRQKPNIRQNVHSVKPIGQLLLKKLLMDVDICKMNIKMVGSVLSCFVRQIKTKENSKSLYLDIMKPKYNFDTGDDDTLIKFEYISHSEPVSIDQDKSPLKVKWDSQYSVDISSITLVSKIATLLKIKDFIMDPLQTPFVQPPSNKPQRSSNDKPKMYQILRMKPWTLEIPSSEVSQDIVSIEFGQVDMHNIYKLFIDKNGYTLNQPIETLIIDISQFTMYTQTENGMLLNTVSNSPSLSLQVDRLFMINNNRSLEDIRTLAFIKNFELVFSASDYLFIYTIFTGNWMFNDLDEQSSQRPPDPPSVPSWNGKTKFLYMPLEHTEQMKISENQFSNHQGFINIDENQILQSFKLEIETFNFHMNPINYDDPLAILIMEDLTLNYFMYRDGIQKTSTELKNVLLLDQRNNTSCVFKEILTRKQIDPSVSPKKSPSSSSPFSPSSPQSNKIPPHIVIDFFMDPNHNRQFTSIKIDHPKLFVSPNSILPLLDFFTSIQPPQLEHDSTIKSPKLLLVEDDQDNDLLLSSSSSSLPARSNKPPPHTRFYLQVTKPKLLLVEDETQQNTNALVMKMPVEFHYSRTSDLNQTMELHASKCQVFRTTPFSQNNNFVSTPITNSFAFNCIFIQFNENDQQTIEMRFQPLNIGLSYKEFLMIQRLINNLSFGNYKKQQKEQKEKEQKEKEELEKQNDDNNQENNNNDDEPSSSSSTTQRKDNEDFVVIEDSDNIMFNSPLSQSQQRKNRQQQLEEEEEEELKRKNKELEKKKKERKQENSKSKSLVAPGRPDDSYKLMHKTRVHVEFLGRISFTLIDESVTMKDIPFVQMNIGEFTSDYWGWEEYSFLTCDMQFKVEVFNQKHMAFDSLVEQFQLNVQVLQSDDPKLKITLKSLSNVNVNISQPFIQALGNFYQNILKINNSILNNNNNNVGGGGGSNGSSLNNSINGNIVQSQQQQHLANSFSSPELIIFETNEELILNNDNAATSSNSHLINSPNNTMILNMKKSTSQQHSISTSPSSTTVVSPRGTFRGHQRSISNTTAPITTTTTTTTTTNSNNIIPTIHDLSVTSSSIQQQWRKPVVPDYLELNNNSASSKNSLSNSIINSKVRDMRSTVDLASLNSGGAQVHRHHSRQNSSVTSPLMSSSLNTPSLYSTESNNQFWIVNLTGKAIEYYVEDLNFIQSYNINDQQTNSNTVINLNGSTNTNQLFNSNNSINSNGSAGGSASGSAGDGKQQSSSLSNNQNRQSQSQLEPFDEDDYKLQSKKTISIDQMKKVIKNNEKQGVELKSALFKTRDFRTHGSLNANIAIRFKEDDEYPWIHNVSINQIGDNFYFPPYGNKANIVVCEVGWDEKNETKIATLRSPVMIKNSANIPIDICLSNPKGESQEFPIRIDEKYYIPVDFWNSNSSISIRPHGKDYDFDKNGLNLCESSSWSEAFIFDSTKNIVEVDNSFKNLNINDEINNGKQSIFNRNDRNNDHSSSSGSANNSTSNLPQIKKEHMFLGALCRSGIRCDRTGLITTTLVVTPPLIFENVLMCDIELRFVSHSKRKTNDFLRNALSKTAINLAPGKQTPWYFNHSNDIGILLSLKGLGKNQYFHLPSSNFNSPLSLMNQDGSSAEQSLNQMNSFTQEITFQCSPEYSSNTYSLNLKIDHRFEGGCHIASIYCINAIHNHTMIPFLLRPSNIKEKLTLETNESPLLVSHDKFYIYHPSAPKFASKEFDIILGKEDIIEIQFENKLDQMKFQFKAIVTTGYNIFFRTRIVDIYPRFILINKLPVDLSYTQYNKDVRAMARDSHLLEPNSSIPFHWYNGKEEQQLSVTIAQGTNDHSYQYSGGIRIDQVGVNFLKLRHQHDEQIEQSIKVEVRDTSESTLVIFYSNDPQNLPFHIKNESYSTINFQQKCVGSKKYTLKPGEKLYYTWDFPSAERQLTVSIDFFGETVQQDINLNKIKVFKPIKLPNNQTIFPIVESSNGTTRDLLFTTQYKEQKELDLLDFAIECSFPNLGFSLIDDVPQEMIYVSFKDFNYWISSSNLTHTTWLLIDDIQIDNQQPNTEFPVLLWCDKKKDSEALPFLEYSAVKLKKKNIEYYDLIALYLNEMYCQLDDRTLLNLNNFYQKIPMEKFQDPNSIASLEGIPENFYIKWLIFAEIKIYLTFSISRDGILSNYNKMPALRLVVPSLGKSLGQLENAPLNINQLGIKNIFTTKANLSQLLMSHYTKQMKRQIHVILGSSSIFGSPLVFFNNISTGMTEAIEDPIIGSIQLMKRILYAAANSSSKLFGTISSGFATWSLDETYLRKRDAEEKVKAKHIAHGIYLGSKGFVMGIANGLFGIVEHPIKGAMQEGAFGFLKGCGKGILGIAVKPVTGVFDFASKTSEGIRNNTNIHPERFRIRTPRFINPREPIKEYSIDESEGNFLLKRNSEDIVKNEGTLKMEYKFHVVLPDCTLLLTNHSLICLSKKGIYRWSFPLSEISKLRIFNSQDKCKLNIHLRNYRSFGTFSQLRKKISIHCQNESVLYQLYSKITSCFNKSNQLEIEENNEQDNDKNMIAMISRN